MSECKEQTQVQGVLLPGKGKKRYKIIAVMRWPQGGVKIPTLNLYKDRRRVSCEFSQNSQGGIPRKREMTEIMGDLLALICQMIRKMHRFSIDCSKIYAILQAQYLRDTRAVLAFAVDQDVLTGKIGMYASPLCYFMAQQVDDS